MTHHCRFEHPLVFPKSRNNVWPFIQIVCKAIMLIFIKLLPWVNDSFTNLYAVIVKCPFGGSQLYTRIMACAMIKLPNGMNWGRNSTTRVQGASWEEIFTLFFCWHFYTVDSMEVLQTCSPWDIDWFQWVELGGHYGCVCLGWWLAVWWHLAHPHWGGWCIVACIHCRLLTAKSVIVGWMLMLIICL